MRLTAAMAMTAVLMAAGGTRLAAEANPAPARTVTICMDSAHDIQIRFATRLAADMFSAVGIRTVWRLDGLCPLLSDAIQVRFAPQTPNNERPGALAYARPYEGTRIVVYYDRLQSLVASESGCKGQINRVLAYVLVHEITHILEGVSRHSPDGIMKAIWDKSDYFQMAGGKFALAPQDIDLIDMGLDARARRPASAAMAAHR